MRKPRTKAWLQKKLTSEFNAYIRKRDAGKMCISCGKKPMTEAGHYYPTSTDPHPSMRFHEMNVNGQCSHCNHWLRGNIHGYRQGLIKKYGEMALRNLEITRSISKNPWSAFEYEAMIQHYKEKNQLMQS
jgi:hypothetical protein